MYVRGTAPKDDPAAGITMTTALASLGIRTMLHYARVREDNMSTTTSTTAAVTIKMSQEIKDGLEALANTTSRDKDSLAQEALHRYLETESGQIAKIQRAIEAADAGRYVTDEEMKQVWAEFGLDADE